MPFELQPILKGEILELRPLQEGDFPALFAVASDPLIWEQHPVPDRCKLEVFRGFFAGIMKSGGATVAVDLKDGRVIGSSRFDHYDEAKCQIEIGGTFLARSHWGGVYNREMKRLMLQHAFQFVNRVIFVVGIGNFRSQRAMEKIGAASVGTKIVPNVGEHYIYQISAGEFRNYGLLRDVRCG
jgi:RimJ/RimL family protein N-acetyltransferase